jgi:dienelactone hydrolase
VQGADILAQAGNFAVYMPDWFEGKPADISWYPPDTEEKGAQLKAFFNGIGAIGPVVARAEKVVEELGSGKWGVVGLCWGGKVATQLSASPSRFSFAASAHPAMVDAADALKITIPTALLASKDEDSAAVDAFASNLSVDKHVETFPDQVHGWMGARSDLEDDKCRAEYERGYRTLVEFFGKFV